MPEKSKVPTEVVGVDEEKITIASNVLARLDSEIKRQEELAKGNGHSAELAKRMGKKMLTMYGEINSDMTGSQLLNLDHVIELVTNANSDGSLSDREVSENNAIYIMIGNTINRRDFGNRVDAIMEEKSQEALNALTPKRNVLDSFLDKAKTFIPGLKNGN